MVKGLCNIVELHAVQFKDYADNTGYQTHYEELRLEIAVTAKQNAQTELYAEIDGKRIRLRDGKGRLTIENPRLWWVREMGSRYLQGPSLCCEEVLRTGGDGAVYGRGYFDG